MKLFAIAAIVALPSANAVYYACCKRANTCPTDRNNTKMGNTSFEVCCYDGQSANGTALDKISTCLDDIETEGGVSIALYSTPQVVTTSNTPEATVTSTSTTPEVTAISTLANECCLALAAAQPGKLRSAATTSSLCPETMHSIDGATHVEDNAEYQVCCDEDGLASDINAEGFPVCDDVVSTQTPAESIDTATPPEQETTDITPQTSVEPTDSASTPGQETKLGDGSNSATAMNGVMFGVAVVGAVLQAVL